MAQIAIPQDHKTTYLERMEKGFEDKLWFLDNPLLQGVAVYFDFGCADGFLAEVILTLRKDLTVIVYDEDDNFLDEAEKRLQKFPDRYLVCRTLEQAQEALYWFKYQNMQTATIFSSVLHEVQSFVKAGEWEDFLNDITIDCSDFLVIRDMGTEEEAHMTKIAQEDFEKVRGFADTSQLEEFEHHWGRVSFQAPFVHWLLKYHYTENWERELLENYLVDIGVFVEDIEVRDYSLEYEEYYTLPWIKDKVQEDFDIQLVDPTHFKMIFKRDQKDG